MEKVWQKNILDDKRKKYICASINVDKKIKGRYKIINNTNIIDNCLDNQNLCTVSI